MISLIRLKRAIIQLLRELHERMKSLIQLKRAIIELLRALIQLMLALIHLKKAILILFKYSALHISKRIKNIINCTNARNNSELEIPLTI